MRGQRWLTGALAAAALAGPPAFAAQQQTAQPTATQQPTIEPQADQVLKRMSDYLKGLNSFSFDTTSTQEAVTTEGQKLDFEGRVLSRVEKQDGASFRLGPTNQPPAKAAEGMRHVET